MPGQEAVGGVRRADTVGVLASPRTRLRSRGRSAPWPAPIGLARHAAAAQPSPEGVRHGELGPLPGPEVDRHRRRLALRPAGGGAEHLGGGVRQGRRRSARRGELGSRCVDVLVGASSGLRSSWRLGCRLGLARGRVLSVGHTSGETSSHQGNAATSYRELGPATSGTPTRLRRCSAARKGGRTVRGRGPATQEARVGSR